LEKCFKGKSQHGGRRLHKRAGNKETFAHGDGRKSAELVSMGGKTYRTKPSKFLLAGDEKNPEGLRQQPKKSGQRKRKAVGAQGARAEPGG